MNTFSYRDARRRQLTKALAAVTGQQGTLRDRLLHEQSLLQSDDWWVTDTTYQAVAAEWLWINRGNLRPLADQDPVSMALAIPSPLTVTQETALLRISAPSGSSGPPDTFLEQILGALGGQEAALTQLVHAAHQSWFEAGPENAPYLLDEVGVLLPIRLETLFDGPGGIHNPDPAKWLLSLRVIPDEASICRDNAFISPEEGKALVSFWRMVQKPGELKADWLDGEAAEIAWEQLTTQIIPERAAWLVGSIGVRRLGDDLQLELPEGMPDGPEPNRVGGMPPELHVYAVTTEVVDGLDHHLLGRLPQDTGKRIDARELSLPLPSSADSARDSWWASWSKAREVGLGGEFLLPVGMKPQNIQALYVVGIGDESPETHFTAQVNAGELSILRLGTPTNNVPGKAAGEEANWRKVAQTRLKQRLTPLSPPPASTGAKLQRHLLGKENILPFFPGADAPDDTLTSQDMVRALWPALWGTWFRDIWGEADDACHRGNWAFQQLCPEGPLMPLRIGDQPYGLLPVTSLDLWEVDAAEGETPQQRVEMKLAKELSLQRNLWAGAVQDKRCVVNKSTEQFMGLLGQSAQSHGFLQRNFLSLDALSMLYQLDAPRREEFKHRSLRAYETASSVMGREPSALYLATSNSLRARLPLVQPTQTLLRHRQGADREPLDLQELVSLLTNFPTQSLEGYELEEIFSRFWRLGEHGEYQMAILPDSLLIRLLVHACQTSYQWKVTDRNPLLRDLVEVHQKAAWHLAATVDDKDWRQKEENPFTGEVLFRSAIPEETLKKLERAFRATLDSAAQRLDPWITGFAWQRLQNQSHSSRHHHRLGVYGWVEGPFVGQPGPTEAGLLHTPSYNQTLAALILRDKFLSSARQGMQNETGNNPWQMDISSQKVRVAEQMAEEVRMGFHIFEILGRRVEKIIGNSVTVQKLRQSATYAMHPERRDPKEVCNGKEALLGLNRKDPMTDLWIGDPTFPLTASQREALQLLEDALDTYSDLLMGDGVIQLINRQTDRAAETMDAAAGASRPPSFDFIRTPPSGYQLESMVLSVLPFVPLESLVEVSHPIRLADPSVAAFLEKKLGKNWVWKALDDDKEAKVLDTLKLSSLGLSPLDTLSLPEDLLREMVRLKIGLPLVYITQELDRQWEATSPEGSVLGVITLSGLRITPEQLAALDDTARDALIRKKLKITKKSVIREVVPLEGGVPVDMRLWIAKDEENRLLGMVSKRELGEIPEAEQDLHRLIRRHLGLPQVRITAPRQYQQAQQLLACLGTRPAAGRDLAADKSDPAPTDTSIYGELLARYSALYLACGEMAKALETASDDPARIKALRQALAWGIIPASTPADRRALLSALCGFKLPDKATPLATLVKTAAEALKTRLKNAAPPTKLASELEIGKPLVDHEVRKQSNVPDGIPTLARAIIGLASPDARLVVLACWDKAALIGNTGLVTKKKEDIEEQWLTVVAAVRDNLARLEALQLEIPKPLDSWTNSPKDPWRTGKGNIVQQNLESRNTSSVATLKMTRFVAAYGPTAPWTGSKVAVGLIDAFNESQPMPQRSTAAAFGFNAPSARAPQAILLAVPPKPRQRLNPELLFKITEETRQLAHARMARLEDLGNLQSLVPTMWLPSNGPTRVRLEPWPLFEI